MKAVYTYDNNNVFNGSKIVADDYTPSGNETFIKPIDGSYEPIKWNGSGWDLSTQADYLAAHPAPAVEPTAEQLMINVLGQQIGTLTTQLAQATATSTAPTSGTTTTDNGGAA